MIVFKYDVTKEKEIFNFPYFQRNSQYLNVMLQEELDQVVIAENDKFITDRISFIKKQWEKVESTFLKSLGDFYETELVMPDITCYLIRLNIFPYGYGKNQQEEWFAAPLADTTMRVLGVAMHELTHYFQPHKLPRSVKEAIPVILDDAEKFKIVNYDKGHKDDSKEMEWRKIIFNLYKDGGKFSDLEALVQERKDEFEGQNWEGRTA